MSPGDMAVKIRVGKFTIGVVGLNAALAEADALRFTADEAATRHILERLRAQNYIPPAAESEYLQVIQREYRRPRPTGCRAPDRGHRCEGSRARLPQLRTARTDGAQADGRGKIAGNLEHVRDMKEISFYGIVPTPGLVINGRIRCAGRVPTERQLLGWLREAEKAGQSDNPGRV